MLNSILGIADKVSKIFVLKSDGKNQKLLTSNKRAKETRLALNYAEKVFALIYPDLDKFDDKKRQRIIKYIEKFNKYD